MIKKVVKNLLKRYQLEVRAVDSPTRSFSRAVAQLKKEIAPSTIIDIGVADGTPDLYVHFPTHPYLLVEANPHYQTTLKKLQTQLDARVETVFCGAQSGETSFNVYEDPRKSSTFEITRQLELVSKIKVPVQTLDNLVEKHQLEGPFLLKLDVEGAELEVLKGAAKTVSNCEAIIAEASILPKYKGGPEFADLVCLLKEHGFSVFDIAAGTNDGRNGRLQQVDLIFVKTTAPFRNQNKN